MISAVPRPGGTLMARYDTLGGAYTDCFACAVPTEVDLATYLSAFYRTRLFGLERRVLAFAGWPSTETELEALALGERGRFAAWTVEERRADELLMCDVLGRTRSWFRVEPQDTGTRLYFGSAVVPDRKGRLGPGVRLLVPAHRAYSRALLGSARRRILRASGEAASAP